MILALQIAGAVTGFIFGALYLRVAFVRLTRPGQSTNASAFVAAALLAAAVYLTILIVGSVA